MVILTNQSAQKSKICPLCGVALWKKDENLQTVTFHPVTLKKNYEVSLCQACLAELSELPDEYRWMRFLELFYKRQQEISSQPTPGRKTLKPYGQEGR